MRELDSFIDKNKDFKIDKTKFIKLRSVNNSIYHSIKIHLIFHSNKLEGSTFSIEGIESLIKYREVIGDHNLDDIIETMNSLELFDFVIDTLNEPLTKRLLLEWHSILKDKTKDDNYGFKGCFKKIPNRLTSVDLKICQPYEVEYEMEKLLNDYNNKKLIIDDIAKFHSRFEQIHPFQDGNGRIGRFIIMKQCIENELPIICLDNSNNEKYRKSLYESQTSKNYDNLINLFKDSQNYFNIIMEDVRLSLDNI